jgi:hypothetical protein
MNVTTWIGFACTVASGAVTVLTVLLRNRARVQLAAIASGKPEAARIVADAVTSFDLDTSNLTKEQIWDLAKREIENRYRQRGRLLWFFLLLAAVLCGTTVALAQTGSGPTSVTTDTTTYQSGAVHVGTVIGSMTIDQRHSGPAPAPAPTPSQAHEP